MPNDKLLGCVKRIASKRAAFKRAAFKRAALGGLFGLSLLMCLDFASTVSAADKTESDRPVLRQGLPGRRMGGGTRNPAMAAYNDQTPLAALIPETVLSVTTAARPTLLFHLPIVGNTQTVEFVLYNSEDELLFQTQQSVSGQPGIVSVDLSAEPELSPLLVNEPYQWFFSIVAEDRAHDISVDGWIQRVALDEWLQQQAIAPDVLNNLAAATPLEQVRLLSQEANLWTDAAVVLHELRQRDPNNPNVMMAWDELLNAEGLSELSEEPVAELSVNPAAASSDESTTVSATTNSRVIR